MRKTLEDLEYPHKQSKTVLLCPDDVVKVTSKQSLNVCMSRLQKQKEQLVMP